MNFDYRSIALLDTLVYNIVVACKEIALKASVPDVFILEIFKRPKMVVSEML